MPWDPATLTTLTPGDRVSVVVLPDDTSPMVSDMHLAGRVMAVELVEYIALPFATWFAGAGRVVASSLVMDWENFTEALDPDSGVFTIHVPVGDGERSEKITVVADEPDDA